MTIIEKDPNIYVYSNFNNSSVKLKEKDSPIKSNTRYFVDQHQRLDFLNPELLIFLTHLPCKTNLLKINAKTLYIDLRSTSYEQEFIKANQQKIEILILKVIKVYGFNRVENNEGFFDEEKEFDKTETLWPSAVSIVKFLKISKLINSLKLLLIDSNADLNIKTLKSMIENLCKNRYPIKVECFKSSNNDKYKEYNKEIKQKIEFCFNAESKAHFDSLLQQNLNSPNTSELIQSHKPKN